MEVGGDVAEQVVEQVDGTLEQRKEKIDDMTRQLASKMLQASVDRMDVLHPLFRLRQETRPSLLRRDREGELRLAVAPPPLHPSKPPENRFDFFRTAQPGLASRLRHDDRGSRT